MLNFSDNSDQNLSDDLYIFQFKSLVYVWVFFNWKIK